MDLIDFYKELTSSIGCSIDETGKIYNGKDDDRVVLTTNKKCFMLPTKDNLDNLTEIVDGEVKTKFNIFNPFKDDSIASDNNSLRQVKSLIDRKIQLSIYLTGVLLIDLHRDDELQKKAKLFIRNGISKKLTAVVGNKAISKVFDDKTSSNWTKLFEATLGKTISKGLAHIFIGKGGKDESGNRFTRRSKIVSEVHKDLDKAIKEKSKKVYDIDLRNKDKEVFKAVIEFILEDLLDVDFTTTVNNAAGATILLDTYLKISKRLNNILKNLKIVDEETVEEAEIEINLTSEIINTASEKFKTDLAMIPDDKVANQPKSNGLSSLKSKVANSASVSARPTLSSLKRKEEVNNNTINSNNINNSKLYTPENNVTPPVKTSDGKTTLGSAMSNHRRNMLSGQNQNSMNGMNNGMQNNMFNNNMNNGMQSNMFNNNIQNNNNMFNNNMQNNGLPGQVRI